jgi:hypothetical protein
MFPDNPGSSQTLPAEMYPGFSRPYPGRIRIIPDVYRGSVGM